MNTAQAFTARPLRQVFLERLMDAGTWCSRDELTAGTSSSPVAIEDTLADLVVEGLSEYREHVGYRLKGSSLQRRAVKLMREQRTNRQVYGQPVGDQFHVAVVEQAPRAGLDLVMYELAVPLPEEPAERLAVQRRVAQQLADDFSTRGL